jgi:hypothetical protein
VVLRRLSAFVGGCTLEAAEAVVADATVPEWQVAEHMASLIAKSLVIAERTAEGARYRLLETTRAYAQERLAKAAERPVVMRRHGEYLCAVFERASAELETMASGKWALRWRPELDNLRTVLDWSFEQESTVALGVTLTAMSADLWDLLGDEGRARIDTAFTRLDNSTPPATASALWIGKYWAALHLSDSDGTRQAAGQALILARQSGDPVRILNAAIVAATNLAYRGNWAEAEILLQEARTLSVENNYHKALVRVDAEIALKYLLEDRLDEAEVALARASVLNKAVQDDWNEIAIAGRYSTLYALKGAFRASLDKWRETLALSKGLGNSDLVEVQLDCLFMLLVMNKEYQEACDLLISNRGHFEKPARNITNSLRFVILHLGSGHYAEAIRLYSYMGKNWPHLHSARSMFATLFRAVGPLLHDLVPDPMLKSWAAEGENFSVEQARAVCISGIDSFIDYVAQIFESGRGE